MSLISFKRLSWRNKCETLQIPISCERVSLFHYYHNYWPPVVGEELDYMDKRGKRQSFWFICYSHHEKNGRNSRTFAKGKFESHEVSNERWSKFYHRFHFFAILCPLVQDGPEVHCEVGTYLTPTQRNNELVGICNNLIQP